MRDTNWADPLNVLQKFSDAVLTVPSVLGGKIEGVVMKMEDGRFFKVVQSDQYDSEARGAKKDLYRMSPEEMDVYFQKMRKVISVVLNKIGTEGKTDTQIISQANKVLSRIPIDKFPSNPKRNETQIRDDAHETLRLMVGKRDAIGVGTKTIMLMGPTDANRNGPYGQLENAIEVSRSCKYCWNRACPKGLDCLADITVQQVRAKVEELI